MTSIAGVWRRDGRPAGAAEVLRMLERAPGRDPARIALVDGPVALAIRSGPGDGGPEEPAGEPPVAHPAVVADARIDRRESIARALLPATDPAHVTYPAILAAAARDGVAGLARLRGDFAFAVRETPERLLLARDRFGVRPLFWHVSPTLFAFASDLRGLLGHPDVPSRLDEERVAAHLLGDRSDPRATFWQGIRRLAPAHRLVVERGRASEGPYWAAGPREALDGISDAEAAARFRALFLRAVEDRLRGRGGFAAALSGGLDSSSVACATRDILAERGSEPLLTFSYAFDAVPESDEREWIRHVILAGGVDARTVAGDGAGPLSIAGDAFELLGEPVLGYNLFLEWAAYEAAAAAGVGTYLTGLDGDSVVSHGTGHLATLARRGRWWALAREVEGLHRHHGAARRRILRALVLAPMTPGPIRWLRRRPEGRAGILAPRFARRLGPPTPRTPPPPARSEAEAHLRRLTTVLTPSPQEYAGRIAAARGIELVHPFLDADLTDFCLALPPEQKIRRGWTRWVQRRAMEGILPPAVQWRGGKGDLAANHRRGLMELDLPALERTLGPGRGREVLAPYVDFGVLDRVLARFRASGAREGLHEVWAAATLGMWLERADPSGP